MSFFPLPGFVILSDELISFFVGIRINLQPYIVVSLVGLATHILNFAPKYWLAR